MELIPSVFLFAATAALTTGPANSIAEIKYVIDPTMAE